MLTVQQANPRSWNLFQGEVNFKTFLKKSFPLKSIFMILPDTDVPQHTAPPMAPRKTEPSVMDKTDLIKEKSFPEKIKKTDRLYQKYHTLPVSLGLKWRKAAYFHYSKDSFQNKCFRILKNLYYNFINKWQTQIVLHCEWYNIYHITLDST